MGNSYYMPKDDPGKLGLLERLLALLPGYAAELGITPAELAQLDKDTKAFRYALDAFNQMQNNAKQWTAYKNLLRDGGPHSLVPYPRLATLPEPPELVLPGILQRLSGLVARIKTALNYTEVIGHNLGLIGSKQVVDTSTWKPVIETTLEGGRPTLLWSKGKADALEIWAEREAGRGFSFFAISTDPRFTDPTPSPATSALWRYKGIYRIDDKQVGQWSDTHTVTVGNQMVA